MGVERVERGGGVREDREGRGGRGGGVGNNFVVDNFGRS